MGWWGIGIEKTHNEYYEDKLSSTAAAAAAEPIAAVAVAAAAEPIAAALNEVPAVNLDPRISRSGPPSEVPAVTLVCLFVCLGIQSRKTDGAQLHKETSRRLVDVLS